MARDPNAHKQCGDAKNHEYDGIAEIHRDLFNSRRRDVKSSNDLLFGIVTEGTLAALEPGCARRLPQRVMGRDVLSSPALVMNMAKQCHKEIGAPASGIGIRLANKS